MHLRNHFKMEQDGQEGGSGSGTSTGEPVPVIQSQNPDSGNQAAQTSGEPASDNNSGDFKIEDLPQAAQDLIKNLRTENADRRTKSNNLTTRMESIESGLKSMFGGEESQELTPEQQIGQMSEKNESLSYQNAVMGLAYENGVPQESYEYFNFLMDKAVNSLEEGQELSEEDLNQVIHSSKGFSQGGIERSNTSVDGEPSADPNAATGVTLESFVGMSVVEKSELYRKSPEVYNQLMQQARTKRIL